ncbi:hypothetical protein HMPREF3156_02500 [Neisseria sp. HMSC06F02]|nr:hypothetical protein HMPREF3156_02500 [Neisseria sp. HMSC06F02]
MEADVVVHGRSCAVIRGVFIVTENGRGRLKSVGTFFRRPLC